MVSAGEVDLPIRLEERYRRVERTADDQESDSLRVRFRDDATYYDYEATGELALSIGLGRWKAPGVRKTWADGKTQRVEGLLNRFVVGLVRAAEVKKQRDREREEQRRRWEEERRIEKMRRRRAREEQERRKELKRQAAAWGEHRRMREYVAALRRRAERDGRLGAGSSLRRWIEWAEGYLDEVDPLRQPEPPPPASDRGKLYLPARRGG